MKVLGLSGSLRRDSYNAQLLRAAANELPPGTEFEVWDGLRDLPAYDEDLDVDPTPRTVRDLRAAVAGADALLIATPEYNASIPGALKNAIDWASRPWGTNSFARKPSAVIGASPGKIGTAVAQQNLRSILSFCNSPQMNAPEAYVQLTPGLVTEDGEVTDEPTEQFLRDFMVAFEGFITRVLTVLPRSV
jgi:chromate reductase, NAD(P)H dehydrogenase (quinone)